MSRCLATLFLSLFTISGSTIGSTRQDGRFRSEIQLVNVTLTVTDADGRFVPGLRQDDFAVYEDGVRQDVTLFSAERVPVSLGLVLDASASMTSDKLRSARQALDRLIHDLLGDGDELFFMPFADDAAVVQTWTRDRDSISKAIRAVQPAGGTAMYDALARALPTASAGQHRKKALLLISDGNDTGSRLGSRELRNDVRASEVLVYALGIDGSGRAPARPPTPPVRSPGIPLPFPGGRRPEPRPPPIGDPTAGWPGGTEARVNVDALRQLTDDTGGRTEIVRAYQGLDAAVHRLADELRRQYFLGYVSTAPADGQWRSIRVVVTGRDLTVRARRGYIAS